MDFLLSLCVFVLTWTSTITTIIGARDVDWDDVVLAERNSSVTLPCRYEPLKKNHIINWMVMPLGTADRVPLLTANHQREFLHSRKIGLGLANRNYPKTGDLSLRMVATETDVGRYWCLVEQAGKQLKMSVVLLALVDITVVPESPVPEDTTVRLTAQVTPLYAVSIATWLSPAGVALRSERGGVLGGQMTKLPRFNRIHQGIYTYTTRPHGNSRLSTFQFAVSITADMNEVAKFPNQTFGPLLQLACHSRATVVLECPPVLGDYVLLYWQQADTQGMRLAYEHDRWRQSSTNHSGLRLQLLGPTPLVEEGHLSSNQRERNSFFFQLTPEQRDGGVFRCEVFLNDHVHIETTQLSVVHVFAKHSPTELMVLCCLYSEWSQVRRVTWTHQNRTLQWETTSPGRIRTTVSHRPDAAGSYTCTIQLENGLNASALYTVTLPPTGDSTAVYTTTLPPTGDSTAVYTTTLPPTESPSGSVHSLLPSLSALLLLVPVTTMVAGVFLWQRARSISRRGVEHSSYCGEVENIYENPEDLRQPPQGAVYMDLKPTGGDCSVYKELDR
ncbi:g6f-like [Alosa pseudoharengus]|uniref:g6f-like n=1 Tax=Alosa pseudoharengus TaxID=34774 RepID=UPI003F893917